jgi:hypothetical protein
MIQTVHDLKFGQSYLLPGFDRALPIRAVGQIGWGGWFGPFVS